MKRRRIKILVIIYKSILFRDCYKCLMDNFRTPNNFFRALVIPLVCIFSYTFFGNDQSTAIGRPLQMKVATVYVKPSHSPNTFCPFIVCIAFCASSNLSNVTKPNPLDTPSKQTNVMVYFRAKLVYGLLDTIEILLMALPHFSKAFLSCSSLT